jgi:diguanylate cyclase (GGDEF)-like protein
VLATLSIVLVSFTASVPIFFTLGQRLRDSNASLQLELAEHYRDMDRLPSLDELTSQYNRAGFLQLLDREVDRCRRHGLDCCIAMLEIDGFAELHAARGRAAADAVLIQCAARLAGAIRGCDLLGRIDDHRFGLMLPHTKLEKGIIGAERVRRILAQTPMGLPDDNADVQITTSVGMTSVQEADADRETLIRIAEQRLDRAAGAGRDLVIAADA